MGCYVPGLGRYKAGWEGRDVAVVSFSFLFTVFSYSQYFTSYHLVVWDTSVLWKGQYPCKII